LRKFITYIFSSNDARDLAIYPGSLVQYPIALLVIQILAIDLGTICFRAGPGDENPSRM